jgi:hypothetical protein
MASENHTNEIDLVVKYANEKGGGTDGQLIIDSVELERSRDNRVRHGIGNEEPQQIEKGNKTYTFSTTTYMNSAAASALKRIYEGGAETQAVYVRDDGVFKDKASGMVFNTLTTSASDDGDTTVDIDADLLGLDLTPQ